MRGKKSKKRNFDRKEEVFMREVEKWKVIMLTWGRMETLYFSTVNDCINYLSVCTYI